MSTKLTAKHGPVCYYMLQAGLHAAQRTSVLKHLTPINFAEGNKSGYVGNLPWRYQHQRSILGVFNIMPSQTMSSQAGKQNVCVIAPHPSPLFRCHLPSSSQWQCHHPRKMSWMEAAGDGHGAWWQPWWTAAPAANGGGRGRAAAGDGGGRDGQRPDGGSRVGWKPLERAKAVGDGRAEWR